MLILIMRLVSVTGMGFRLDLMWALGRDVWVCGISLLGSMYVSKFYPFKENGVSDK